MNAAPAQSTVIGEADPGTQPILYLDGVSVSFDGFKALNELSFYVDPGELRAIIGPNGAGKTTMMDVITGKTRPDTGKVFFKGTVDLTTLDEAAIANLGIGRKFQKPTVFESHTVFENLELALKTDRSVLASLRFRLSGEQKDKIDEVLKTTALTAQCDAQAGSLSHGQKQWLEIGMLLIQDPGPAAGRRARRRHDRCRDGANRGAAERDRANPFARRRRARYGIRARAGKQGDRAA